MHSIKMILSVLAFGLIFASVASAGASVPVPEPGTLGLLLIGAASLYGLHRYRGRK